MAGTIWGIDPAGFVLICTASALLISRRVVTGGEWGRPALLWCCLHLPSVPNNKAHCALRTAHVPPQPGRASPHDDAVFAGRSQWRSGTRSTP